MLTTLILSKNEIEETKGINSLSLLQKLSLSNNKLTNFEPGTGLNQLSELRLNNNKLLKVSVPAPKLKILDVGNNPIIKPKIFLSCLKQMKKLENLNINNCFKGKFNFFKVFLGITEDDIKPNCPKLVKLYYFYIFIGCSEWKTSKIK